LTAIALLLPHTTGTPVCIQNFARRATVQPMNKCFDDVKLGAPQANQVPREINHKHSAFFDGCELGTRR